MFPSCFPYGFYATSKGKELFLFLIHRSNTLCGSFFSFRLSLSQLLDLSLQQDVCWEVKHFYQTRQRLWALGMPVLIRQQDRSQCSCCVILTVLHIFQSFCSNNYFLRSFSILALLLQFYLHLLLFVLLIQQERRGNFCLYVSYRV